MFRNDMEGLASRVDQLERELGDEKTARATAEAEVARLTQALESVGDEHKRAVKEAHREGKRKAGGPPRHLLVVMVGFAGLVMGGSFGACIAQRGAYRAPDPVASAVVVPVDAAPPPDAAWRDPDGVLAAKLGGLWSCWTWHDMYLASQLAWYRGGVIVAKQQVAYGSYFGDMDRVSCVDGARRALAAEPQVTELDDAIQAYVAATEALDPLLAQIYRYYSDKDYLDDGWAGGAKLDARFVELAPVYEAASQRLYQLGVVSRWRPLAARLEAKLAGRGASAKDELLLFRMSRAAEDALDAMWLMATDVAKLQAAEEQLGRLLDEMEAATLTGKAAEWATMMRDGARTFLKEVKSERRRLASGGTYAALGYSDLHYAQVAMSPMWSVVYAEWPPK